MTDTNQKKPLSREQMEPLINRAFDMASAGVPLKDAQAAIRRELGLDGSPIGNAADELKHFEPKSS